MQPIARVNPKYFAAMNVFAAVQDVRYYLNGIFIEPHPEKGVVIVATDGHTLGLIHDPDGWVAAPIIVGHISKGLISACSVKGSARRLNAPALLYITQHGAVVDTDEVARDDINPFSPSTTHMSKIDIIDGKYPDYRRVIDLKREAGTAFPCVNTHYLARLDAVAKLLIPTNRTGWGVELLSTGRATSVLARFNACDLEHRFLALLMPMQNEAPKTLLPDWLMPKEETTTETEPA
jgi:DNA polymerase-3 subunit beta